MRAGGVWARFPRAEGLQIGPIRNACAGPENNYTLYYEHYDREPKGQPRLDRKLDADLRALAHDRGDDGRFAHRHA